MSFKDAVKKAKGGKKGGAPAPFAKREKAADEGEDSFPAKKAKGGKGKATPFKKAVKKAKAKCKGKKC